MKAAAAVVKHRGVEVRIYGPLPDRQQPVWLLTRHNGSRREKKTVKGSIDDAKRDAKPWAEQVATGDAALRLTPLQNRIFLTAQGEAARLGRSVDTIVREAVEASALLPRGVSLREAATFYSRQHGGKVSTKTVSETIELLYAHLAAKRRRSVTIRSLRTVYTQLATAFHLPIAEVTTSDLETWLSAILGHAPRTRDNYRSALVRLFNFARNTAKILPLETPTAASRLEKGSDDNPGAIQIFKPWEMQKLIALAPARLRPCLALGAFAGLRTVELTRIEWSAIRFPEELPDGETAAKFPHGFVLVDKAAAKQHRSASRRIIPMSANLLAWLLPFRFRSGWISPRRSDAKLSALITALIGEINEREKKAHRPVIGRPRNGLRHSFGTYRLPVLNDTAALALEMNNSPREIVDSYAELAMPRDVEAWWQILPPEPATIVQLELLG